CPPLNHSANNPVSENHQSDRPRSVCARDRCDKQVESFFRMMSPDRDQQAGSLVEPTLRQQPASRRGASTMRSKVRTIDPEWNDFNSLKAKIREAAPEPVAGHDRGIKLIAQIPQVPPEPAESAIDAIIT